MPIENSRPIIVTNRYRDQTDAYLENSIIEPIAQKFMLEPAVLYRPEDSAVIYETYRAASEQKNPLVFTVGGDGTINHHLQRRSFYHPGTIFAPIATGTANDIVTTLNKDTIANNTSLEFGAVHNIQPLNIEYDGNTRQALGYIGINLTGNCANAINGSESLKPSKYNDAKAIIKALLKTRKAYFIDSDNQEFSAMEIAAVNTRMASFLWPHNKNIGIKESYFDLVISKNYYSTAKLALAGLTKNMRGTRIPSGHKVEFTKPDDGIDITAQTDGEHFSISKGHISMYKGGTPVKLLSVRT
ncbi:hypothetical protein KA043_02600 [Candidatus Saccharibacteria bacterium]|jgi:diacylglycerol kinase family enzyme|nr:hypothetical protein [Candidatus Saccharibacteria bacterium]